MNLALFKKHLGDLKILDISAVQIRDFLGARAKTVEPATLHQAFRVLRSFFNWCRREGFIEKSPMENIKAPKLVKKVIPTYTREEIQAMLAVCPLKKFKGARDRAIISIFLDAGIREAELVGMKLNDVDFRGGAIKVFGKGDKERIVHISEKARQALWRYMILRDLKAGNNQRVFLSESGKSLTEDGLRTVIKKIGRAAGVQEVYIHKFRHTCAMAFLRR